MRRLASVLFLAALVAGCPEEKIEEPIVEPPPTPARCELDVFAHPELFSLEGTGSSARVAEGPSDLIGGQFAAGAVGDVVLENDRIRVVVDKPGRALAHTPYGGAIVDADLRRAAGEAGRDQLGKLGMFYAFGRAFDVSRVEIVRDGSEGGPAIVAATGVDALNDFITLQAALDKQQLGIKLLVDADVAQPVRGTHWYVLSPGEDRVRIVTAICNDSDKPVAFPVGDLSAGGGSMDFFNPGQCEGTLGEGEECLADPSGWFGWQGDAVAYGYRSFQVDAPMEPSINALVYLSGSVATVADAQDLNGVLRWVDPNATKRPGNFAIRAGEQKLYVRELKVTRHLGELASAWEPSPASSGTLEVHVRHPGSGADAVNVPVAVEKPDTGELFTTLRTDATGRAKVTLPAAQTVHVTAALPGHAIPLAKAVQIEAGVETKAGLQLGASRLLTVQIKDPFGAPLPGKLVLRCAGPCTPKPSEYRRFTQVEPAPDDVAIIAYVLPSGTTTIAVPPGIYEAIVSRGPEYSLWPETFPTAGAPVDLTLSDATITATLARVVDTAGWLSADLHVHAANSADASPANELRVASFAAEGVETLVSTDHDFVTDYRPVIEALGASAHVATVIGDEISPVWGHHNAFPLQRQPSFTGDALDWAGGAGPALSPSEIYEQLRAAHPGVIVQLNHARGNHGTLTNLKVDTLTGASHADPAALRIAPRPDATPSDTRLFSLGFDAIELQNGFSPNYGTLNDWMVFLSRGAVRTGTSVSDTHTAYAAPAGYSRSWVNVGADGAEAFNEATFIQRIREHAVVGSNGPFLRVTAQSLDAAGQPVGPVVNVGGTVTATSGKVRFTVNVQAPEWMQFDKIELYTHAPGREAFNGETNSTWPASRILQARQLDPNALPLVAVPDTNGLQFRRVEVTETFEVSPTTDAWFVVMVRSSSAVRDLFPLAFKGSCANGACATGSARAFAFANPIFVDMDGSGAYDVFPIPAP